VLPIRSDIHSYGNPKQVRPKQLDLDLTVNFEQKTLEGSVLLPLVRTEPNAPLVLDTRDLNIQKIETALQEKGPFEAAKFELGATDKILGAPLTIALPASATFVRIQYRTSPNSTALQWLTPEQTAGKKHPFLYTQSQAIHARSWIPLQDSPGVRVKYKARIRTPKDLIALMAARRDFRLGDRKEPLTGDYTFRMPYDIPSYLIALAVGDLTSVYVSTRTDVWAEPSIASAAQKEFEDTERMMAAAERIYGTYPWLRYDLLVMPPSFPFGGMENPTLTFATPTVIAGDKSLVSLIAHELAHSWSGNLVTNATWSDFWLNEGFTTYVERRILEAVYGPEQAKMEAAIARQQLDEEIKTLPEKDQILHIELNGRDPDDAVTTIAYEKGALFLSHIEQVVGRELFDAFLFTWLKEHAFQSVTTAEFRTFLEQRLLSREDRFKGKIPVDEWLYKPGIPADAPRVTSEAFTAVQETASQWAKRNALETKTKTKDWKAQQWLHFLMALPKQMPAERMQALDQSFQFTKSTNNQILAEWLKAVIANRHAEAYPKLEQFLMSVGRRWYIRPLYEELAKTEDGKARAKTIYTKARPMYHPITQNTIDGILGSTK